MDCRSCKSDIADGAKLCPICKSYQDWRSVVPISQTTLALIIALFSVAGLAGERISQVLRDQPSSNLNSTILDFEILFRQQRTTEDLPEGGLRVRTEQQSPIFVASFFVTNSGNQPAALRSASFFNSSENELLSCYFGDRFNSEASILVISPGDVLLAQCRRTINDIRMPQVESEQEMQDFINEARVNFAERFEGICRIELSAGDASHGIFEVQIEGLNPC